MIGIEMVESKETRKPLNREKFLNILEQSKELGVLLGSGGAHGNVRYEYLLIRTFIKC